LDQAEVIGRLIAEDLLAQGADKVLQALFALITLLNGAHVLVTRPAHQAENLSRLIAERNGVAVRFPTLAIVAVDNACTIQNTLAHLDRYQWLIFISANAVTMHSYPVDDGKIKKFKSVRIAAIGRATAEALTAGRIAGRFSA
jgi:uroporphyrinogen-III synthase